MCVCTGFLEDCIHIHMYVYIYTYTHIYGDYIDLQVDR